MTDIVARLRQVQGDNEDAREAADEIEKLREDGTVEVVRLMMEVNRLRAEVEEWKERWAAERRDHETTIKHFDTLMNEAP